MQIPESARDIAAAKMRPLTQPIGRRIGLRQSHQRMVNFNTGYMRIMAARQKTQRRHPGSAAQFSHMAVLRRVGRGGQQHGIMARAKAVTRLTQAQFTAQKAVMAVSIAIFAVTVLHRLVSFVFLDPWPYPNIITSNMTKIINFSESRRQTDDALGDLLALFDDELQQVEQAIAEHMKSAADLIPTISEHLIGAGGKRLRPLLTLSAARMTQYDGQDQITMAAAVEYMHTATLLHDDVVDDSDMRRGQPTARNLWGNQASVLVGDFLLGQAFRMMVAAGSLPALDILSSAAATIAEGEVMQLAAMNNAQISEDSYLDIIDAKTAALFAAAAEVGGVISNAETAERKALAAYGRNLGIAFQLIDDALDYGSVNRVLGKNIGEDFAEGKVTLPVILAYHRGDKTARAFWEEAVSTPNDDPTRLDQALELIAQTDALTDTIERARHYGDKAKDAIALFAADDVQKTLIRLVDFCIARAY
jgi:octaprenyl-diphosphate synthase